jgi:hypothetical protein
MAETIQPIPSIEATRILIKVDGFRDAKRWLYRLLHAGIATCSTCDKPAVYIFWNDAAEWYFECEDHYDPREQWTGSTHWNPSLFSKRVILDKAQEWYLSLEPEEQRNIRFETYDATNWDEWLIQDHWKNPDVELLHGSPENGTFVQLYPLKNGQFAYEISQRSASYAYYHGLVAPFNTRELAIEAARRDRD